MKKSTLISIALIVVLGFAVYANSLKGQFLWDDEFLVVKNTYVKSWSNIARVFREDIARAGGLKSAFYRPLQIITYMLDYSLWELNVHGYHLSNILLHVLAALGLFWLINILYHDQMLAFLTGLLFAVHPIHTEAITYISGRADPLVAVFILLSLIFYIKSLHQKRNVFYLCMLLSYGLALLSRENSLILPALLLLYHYSFRERIKAKQFLSVLILAFLYVLLRFTLFKHFFSAGELAYSSVVFFKRIPGFFVAITNYARLLFLPLHLHMDYGKMSFDFSNPEAILGVLIVLALFVYAKVQRKINGLVFFAVFWFFITLLPSSNLYPLNAYMAEHWLYLPSVGFFLILAGALSRLYRSRRFKNIALVLIVCLFSFYAYLTVRQNSYWREPVAFYKRALKYSPASPELNNNLGELYNDAGKPEEALSLLQEAIRLRPAYYNAHYNLGISYSALRKYEQAVTSYKQAIAFNPDNIKAYNNLGLTYRAMGKNEEALAEFKKAINTDPNYVKVYNNMGVIYHDIGNYKKAASLYKKAIELDANYAEAYNNLAVIYRKSGRDNEAIALWEKVIQMQPDFAQAYYNLALTYLQQKQYSLAIAACDKAKELGFNVPGKLLETLQPHR